MHECNQAISGWKEYHMSENTISLYVYKGGQGEITEKKSRFIATVRPVESEDEAVSFINEMKKKYWDARHNCSAFVIGKRQELTRCSDDGEPAGTAGRPMLDVLLKENIHNAAIVVTRYFGGVLLGTGGLVRAYQQATKAGLSASEIIEKKDGAVLFIRTDYTGIGRLQYLFAQEKITVMDTAYEADVLVKAVIPENDKKRIEKTIIEQTNGTAKLEWGDEVTFAEYDGEVQPLTDVMRSKAQRIVEEMNAQGMRVLALAQKSFLSKENNFAIEDEKDMVLIGYLAFLDPPKESAAQAISQLHEHGVEVKVLSGDNEAVVKAISRQVGINTSASITGPELEVMSREAKMKTVTECCIFSKLTPMQKAEIIQLLQASNNTVGFLGDGINDAAALRESDIGISVDSAVDIAKESADIILLEKDLMVLENGVIEGRKTFGNIVKYVKMTASSNFGNMFSVLAASAFLPFLPMLPIHLLIQNLLYDISQTTIPFDRMDSEYLRKPRVWDSADLSRFMIWIGPISSIFDIATYIIMWWVFKCQGPDMESLFQSGWFIEGLLSQTLIVHMIRTRKVPFIQSSASWPVMFMTFSIMAIGICIPFTPFGSSIGLTPLPLSYFPWLIGILLSYCVLTQWLKTQYIRVFKRWL